MRRRYTAREYLEIAHGLRRARPGLAITTDLIVGFPGESDADFEQTLALVREVAFDDSYSFKYSPRPGTAAAKQNDAIEPERAQARLEELQALQRELTLASHRRRVGTRCEVLVHGLSRRGGNQWTGRDLHHRIVNFAASPGASLAAGNRVSIQIVDATPHSLIGQLGATATAFPASAAVRNPLRWTEEGESRRL
jgi:tRNA-2-methylthio-N6-dimethylallyladenosine synthase